MKIAERLIILCLLTFPHCGFAQSPQIDSLNRLIRKASSDTARINLSVQKARQLNTINLDTALAFAQQVLVQANKKGYQKGQAALLTFMASVYSIKSDYASGEQNINKLKTLLKSSKDSVATADIDGAYGDMYSIQEHYDTSNILLLKAVGMIERNGYSASLIVYYSDLGINYQQQANYPQAIIYQQKTSKLASRENRIGSLALALSNMGVTYAEMGDTIRSNRAFEEAVALAEKNNIIRVAVYGYTN